MYVFIISFGISVPNIIKDLIEARRTRVVCSKKVREKPLQIKGEFAEGRNSPKFLSGSMQKMHRTVTFCGELSALYKESSCHGYLCVSMVFCFNKKDLVE